MDPEREFHLLYFAMLRDTRGLDRETVRSRARTARELWAELDARHALSLAPAQMRVAVDDAIGAWDDPLPDGARVAFLPPVAGG
jgi:molybdopterin converting factor small subunit